MEKWERRQRPGYFGSRRDATMRKWDQEFGPGNWKLGWKLGENEAGYNEACMLYEDSYYEFLRANPDVLETLTAEASDVYDTDPSNVASGLDYNNQTGPRTHIQDISLRRCLVRLGRAFRGSRLIQIRFHAEGPGVHALSPILTPGRVPFHYPHLMEPPLDSYVAKPEWYDPQSVEAFYQFNKYLYVRTG